MRRIGGAVAIAMLAVLAAACSKAPEEPASEVRRDPVVVYAAFKDDAALRDTLAAYTDETGVLVIVRSGDPDAIVDDVIENEISPPADLLITRSVVPVWQAAEEGALRPHYSETRRERTPAWSRDPDDFWFSTAFNSAVVAYAASNAEVTESVGFAALAEPRFRGGLCLSTSANPINRAVIAMMIEEMGVRPAEIAVRGWIANLARPVFETESDLIAAIQSGACGAGIVSSRAIALARQTDVTAGVAVTVPATTYAEIDGVGIARHARNPEGAAALVDWLFSTPVQQNHTAAELTYPTLVAARHHVNLDSAGRDNVAAMNVGLVAWHQDAAAKLAERARYY